MNKNRYRVIFSQARGVFIAVAEIVKSRTKTVGQSSATETHDDASQITLNSYKKLNPLNFAVIAVLGAVVYSLPLNSIANTEFPKKYVDLISKYNGLSFIESWFNYINYDGEIDEASFSFLAYGNPIGSSSIESSQDFDIYSYNKIINFGTVGNGDYISFDYRSDLFSKDPQIVMLLHDKYVEDEDGNLKMKIIKIADNFNNFLDMLHS